MNFFNPVYKIPRGKYFADWQGKYKSYGNFMCMIQRKASISDKDEEHKGI